MSIVAVEQTNSTRQRHLLSLEMGKEGGKHNKCHPQPRRSGGTTRTEGKALKGKQIMKKLAKIKVGISEQDFVPFFFFENFQASSSKIASACHAACSTHTEQEVNRMYINVGRNPRASEVGKTPVLTCWTSQVFAHCSLFALRSSQIY